jgi:hypothetical protein
MKILSAVVILLFVYLIGGCASDPILKKEKIYGPIESSLCNLNQKVSGYFLEVGMPDVLGKNEYIRAVDNVCFSNPTCKLQADGIFSAFIFEPRRINDMFSVMLCDKELKFKVMEDFSCNNRRVEVQTWRQRDDVPCNFEVDSDSIIRKYCEH